MQSLIKGIRDHLLKLKKEKFQIKRLGEICSITIGKLDANAMEPDGIYPFFTCAEEVYRINTFAFNTEALLISGNGANVGYIHYYKGRFNAYQRTYVLTEFKEDIQYIYAYLEAYLYKRIALEKSTSNTPYIVLGTLYNMLITIPDIRIQKNVSNVCLLFKSKLNTEYKIRDYYKTQKSYLLSQMFI